jgi:hypothetical protein
VTSDMAGDRVCSVTSDRAGDRVCSVTSDRAGDRVCSVTSDRAGHRVCSVTSDRAGHRVCSVTSDRAGETAKCLQSPSNRPRRHDGDRHGITTARNPRNCASQVTPAARAKEKEKKASEKIRVWRLAFVPVSEQMWHSDLCEGRHE